MGLILWLCRERHTTGASQGTGERGSRGRGTVDPVGLDAGSRVGEDRSLRHGVGHLDIAAIETTRNSIQELLDEGHTRDQTLEIIGREHGVERPTAAIIYSVGLDLEPENADA
jgi:hypothetical protein